MIYNVTFLLAGEEQTESIEAADAASAVAKTQFDHGRGDDQFELISVQLSDTEESDEEQSED
jgi:hypothetical protein